jgi:hypothetical protein
MEHALSSSAPLTTRAGLLIGLAAGAVGVAAIPDLASGDVAGAAADSLAAADLLVVLSPELVFEGLAGSLGL